MALEKWRTLEWGYKLIASNFTKEEPTASEGLLNIYG
jgi:hypothetical protein